jgi:hypothetical protein
MRIHFERLGGFAGIRLRTEIDTATLAEDEARSLESLVKQAQLDELRQQRRGQSNIRDAFEYGLTVEDEGKRYSVRVTDETIPAVARPLFDRLVAAAKRPHPRV